MKKILLGTVVVAISIYLMLTYLIEDVQINKYSDIHFVQEQKAIEQGWIPEILPVSAYDIVETHDIDKNTIFGTFSYKEKDEEKFLQNMTVLNDDNQTLAWKNFLFRVDRDKNYVRFRNRSIGL